MKKLYVTLFSALFLGGAICASCTDKKDASAEEVINTIRNTDVLFGIMPPITPEIWKLIF